jgi:hypothetical protein
MKSAIVTLMADEEGMQRKHKLLAAETNDYFCHTYPELTERWRQAMLTQPPSVLRDLSVELLGLESVTNRVKPRASGGAHRSYRGWRADRKSPRSRARLNGEPQRGRRDDDAVAR